MKLWSTNFNRRERLPEEFAFARGHAVKHIILSNNRNPHFAWSELPEGTKSLVLTMHDTDAPDTKDKVNKEGMIVPVDQGRREFTHWVLVDLLPSVECVEEGEYSDGITAKGKSGPDGPHGTRQGVNDYTGWFEDDPSMAGTYFGYDGPCPPWNDTMIHNYTFTLYALSVERCPVEGSFTREEVLRAIEPHVLDSVALPAVYSMEPRS